MDNYSLSDLRAAVDGGNDNWGGVAAVVNSMAVTVEKL